MIWSILGDINKSIKMDRIFINVYEFPKNWIMRKIADDIQEVATSLGYKCRCGKFEDYDGEEICYHLSHAEGLPIPKAKHNSVFYTHLNTKLKEAYIVSIKDKFDSFICMSEEDAQFLIELGFDPAKVYGKTLPIRNTYIRPVSIGILSACYPDGRKNEQWLLDYCAENEKAKLINFVFIGRGWGNVVHSLEQMGCSYEWHNVSSDMPYEYQFQQNKLAALDYYIYMGMDGGAMGTYDAYAQDVPLCVTYDGFHKAIPFIDFTFDNKETFLCEIDKIVTRHSQRIEFFNTNNRTNYTEWLLSVWDGNVTQEIIEKDKKCLSYGSVAEKKREQYYPISISGIMAQLRRMYHQIKNKEKYNL